MARGSTVWVSSRIRSAKVDLPWSMWAMIEKLRIWAWSDIVLKLGYLGVAAGGQTCPAPAPPTCSFTFARAGRVGDRVPPRAGEDWVPCASGPFVTTSRQVQDPV